MMKYAVTASIIALSVFSASCAHSPKMTARPATPVVPAASPTLAEGRALYARQQYALAIEKFTQAVREAPDRPEGYNALASAYDMLGRFDLSSVYYEKALARAPSDGRVYRNMARSLKMQGREGEAMALLAEFDAISNDRAAVASAAQSVKVAGEIRSPATRPSGPQFEVAEVVRPAPETTVLTLRRGHAITIDLAEPVPAVVATASRATIGHTVSVALDAPAPQMQRAIAAIRIMNGGGKRGLARGMQGWLAQAGWTQSRTGDLDRRYSRSWIVYPRVHQAGAIALAKSLPFSAGRVVDERASRIVLILGKNAANANLQRARSRAAG